MERYCEQEKNCLRVYVPRELDHHEADRLKQEADFFIETGQVKTLVNFSVSLLYDRENFK